MHARVYIRRAGHDLDRVAVFPAVDLADLQVCPFHRLAAEHLTDDKVHQMLMMDCLVAMVYERRTELNFIEATYVVSARGIRWAKHRLKGYYGCLKDKKRRLNLTASLLKLGFVDKGDVLVRYSDPRIGWKPEDGTLIIGYFEYPEKVNSLKSCG